MFVKTVSIAKIFSTKHPVQESQTTTIESTESKHPYWPELCYFGILTAQMFLEGWTRALSNSSDCITSLHSETFIT